jgi:hypothetical protein
MAVTGQSFLPHLSGVHKEMAVLTGADTAPIGAAGPEREDFRGKKVEASARYAGARYDFQDSVYKQCCLACFDHTYALVANRPMYPN